MTLPVWWPLLLAVLALATGIVSIWSSVALARRSVSKELTAGFQQNAELWESRAALLQQSYDEANARIKALETEIRALKAEQQQDKNKIARRDRAIAALRRRLKATEAERDTVRERLEHAEAEIERLKARLDPPEAA